MKLLGLVQHSLRTLSFLLLLLPHTEGNLQHVLVGYLGCSNQTWSVHGLHVSAPDPLADPDLCFRLRCGCVPDRINLDNQPSVHNVAVDSLIDSTQASRPNFTPSQHTELFLCIVSSKGVKIMLLAVKYLTRTYAYLTVEDMQRYGNRAMLKCSCEHMHTVQIYTEKQAYATGTDVTFLAVTEETDPLEFHWNFGDSNYTATTSTTFIKNFLLPDRYNVSVCVSDGLRSVRSEIYHVVIQTPVQVNRLLYTPSVLLDTPVIFNCRINAGSEVSYLWDFGDETQQVGKNSEHHLFNRTGEFMVKVTVFNLVSSASLKGHLFVVFEPCQPPPVKNMGPSKIQVWRYQSVSLAVTFESQIQCNISRGLLYTWTLYNPAGLQLHVPHIQTDRQDLELPKYLLQYGTYKAVAKVQIVGSIVYSNYSVQIEVMSSPPVSIINGGTNVFISRNNNSIITLDGQKSYDPDFPDNLMSYRWRCHLVNSVERSCFRENIPDTSAVLTFPASALQPDCDLFKFTLTVHSANRSSSSHTFITVRSKPTSITHISCTDCKGNSVSWNQQFSVTAVCENCPGSVTYSWKLYLVNSSSKIVPDVPFCSSVDISLPSKLEEGKLFSQQPDVTAQTSPVSHSVNFPNHYQDNPQPLTRTKVSHWIRSRLERSVGHPGGGLASFDLLSELESVSAVEGSGASDENEFLPYESTNTNTATQEYFSVQEYEDYEFFHSGLEEADAGEPVGRPTGPFSSDDVITHLKEHEGDNLIDPSSAGRVQSEKSLLDLDRELVHPVLFQSFTLTGISSSVIMFKPNMLKPRSLYMLEVLASVDQALLGKAQLFLNTHSAPEGMACHVQPSTGLEIHTHFSVFCTSGQEDLLYEYGFIVGNSTKRCLYMGRDNQHYFSLPAGDPYNNYEVTIYIEIQNRFGSSTKPCPVPVTVLPSFQRTSSSNPDQELLLHGLGNVTNLMLMKSSRDLVNYVSLLTVVLNRLSLDVDSSVKLQTHTRSALISAVCQLTVTNQILFLDILLILADLLKVSNQVTFDSTKLVIKYIDHLSSDSLMKHMLDVNTVKDLLVVLSHILEAPIPSSRAGIQLTRHVLYIITDSVLVFLQSREDLHFNGNFSFIMLSAQQHYGSPATVKIVNMATVHLPDVLHMHNKQENNNDEQSSCFIFVLTSYKQNPYHWSRTPLQVDGDVADIKLFNCTTRREIKRRYLSTPVVIEFQKRKHKNMNDTMKFTLIRSEVNTHQFSITPELLQTALQLRVEFIRPVHRAFPITLLFRMHKRPTPTVHHTQKVYRWNGQKAQIFLPPSSLKDAGTGYLMLLNADYNTIPINKYTAHAVNYTLSIDSIQCLAWDGMREWRPDGCSVLQAFTSTRINCSCNHLTSFTAVHQTIHSTYSFTNVTEFTSNDDSLTVCIFIAVSVAVYAVLWVFCKRADVRTETSSGSFLLPDNDPADQFLYSVTIHTGLRSRASMTAKVYIMLYGESGVSQTRELSSSDHKLFTSNSTNTFILSTPWSLGRVWQVYLWHDSSGFSPSWFLSHVQVKDLLQGCSWIFQAQCWLAVDEGDGQVERRLRVLEKTLLFRECLYLKLEKFLQDFHPWLSVYSRPSHSTHTHIQRLSVCYLLLQAYMCANAVLIYQQEEQYSSELGLIGVSLVSVGTGLCALILLPVGSLISYLFRISKLNNNGSNSGDQYKFRLPYIYSVEEHHDALMSRGRVSESNLLYSSSSWSQNRGKCEQGIQDRKDTRDSVSGTCNRLKPTDSISCIEVIEEHFPEHEEKFQDQNLKHSQCDLQSRSSEVKKSSLNHQICSRRSNTIQVYCYHMTWVLWLFLCLVFMIITGTLSLKFNSTKNLLWIQSVFFSLIFCGFVVHPAMILFTAVCTSLWRGQQDCFFQSSNVDEPITELLKYNQQSELCFNTHLKSSSHHQPEITHFEKVLVARQRARYLRLARPPTLAERKCLKNQIKRRTLINKAIRKMVLFMVTLLIAGFIAYGKSSTGATHLNQVVRTWFSRDLHRPIYSTQKPDTWWNWTENTLLYGLYQNNNMSYNGIENNVKSFRGTYSLIGEPVIRNMGHSNSSCQTAQMFRFSEIIHRPSLCGKFGCYKGEEFHFYLGKNRSEMSNKLQKLKATNWVDANAKAMMVQFTLYSPPYNLFTTVSVLGERTPIAAVQPSVFIHSTRLYGSDTALDYWLMAAELLFLLLTLLQLYVQLCALTQRGWLYWVNLWNWLEMMTLLISVLGFICTVHHFTLRTALVDHLQREDFKKFVDISSASSWEQISRSLYGVLVFLLLMKSCFVLSINEAMPAAVSAMSMIFSNLLWPLIAGLILVIAFSCMGNLFFHSDFHVFSSLPRSMYWITSHCLRLGKVRYLCGSDPKTPASWTLCAYGVLLYTVSVALKAMVIGGLTSFMKTAAKSKRRPRICVSDLVTYIRDMALVFTGKGQQKRMHNHANSNNLYLEEFEDIVDELLLRLDVITDTDVPDDQEDNDNQSCCSSAHYSSEDVDLENTVGMRKHSCVYSASSYMHEEDGESRLRSPLERKTLQPVGGNRGTIHGRSIFTGQKIHTSITTTPVKKSKDLQTFLCSDHSISVQMNECSETLSSNRAKHFSLTWENKVKNVCTKSWSTQADLTPVLNSSNISRTSISSHTKAFNQLCISESPIENTETYCELQTVHIPGQCC